MHLCVYSSILIEVEEGAQALGVVCFSVKFFLLLYLTTPDFLCDASGGYVMWRTHCIDVIRLSHITPNPSSGGLTETSMLVLHAI